jgi:N-acetylglucosaminyldiphosphoundecaprenol N-acetyl-beta-D-mannosaminyltransferase
MDTLARGQGALLSGDHGTTLARADVAGCRIDRLDMAGTLARCEELIATPGAAQHIAINAAKFVAMQADPTLRAIIEECELVSADGQSIVWASRLLGDPLPARVAGIDLMQELLALAEQRGYSVYFLGARQDVLDRALERIRDRHPDLRIAGAHDGYFRDDEASDVAEEVRAARPDILFVAMSSPKKEFWLSRYGRRVEVPFVMGVGGSIDVLAGKTQRAPRLLQRVGLEWAFRLAQEPRRLFHRYRVTNMRFVRLVATELVGRRRGL